MNLWAAPTHTEPEPRADGDAPSGRCRGTRGTALVTALVLLFAFTSGGVILLARDYDDRVATRSSAQAVAFQSARVGAQQIDVDVLRRDGSVLLDEVVAEQAAVNAGQRLLRQYGEQGTVSATAEGDLITVVVEIRDVVAGGFDDLRQAEVRAEGSARAESG